MGWTDVKTEAPEIAKRRKRYIMRSMEAKIFTARDAQIAELVSPEILIAQPGDANEIIANVRADYIVLREHNLQPDFFDLSTRKLGELLQKFDNYGLRLAVIGDFDRYPSKALKALILESNRHGQFLFVSTVEDAIRIWRAIG